MADKSPSTRNAQTDLPIGPRRPMMGGPKVRAKNTTGTLLRLWGYLRRQHAGLIMVLFLVTISTGLNLASPYFIGVTIDRAILKGNLPLLMQYVLILLGIYLASSIFTGAQSYVMARVAQEMVRDLRDDVFVKLQSLPLRYFDQRPHGEIMSRLTNDIDNINNVLNEGVTQFVSSILTLAGVVVLMLVLNPPLALVAMSTIPLVFLITNLVSRHTLKGFRAQQTAFGQLNSIIEESVTGQHVIQAYVREADVIRSFDEENDRLKHSSIQAQTLSMALGPFMNMVGNFNFAFVAAAGGWFALRGWATVGDIASFMNYSRQFGFPLNQIANLYNTIQSALAGAERVFEILDETPELADVPNAPALDEVRGEVVFNDVVFGYDTDQVILNQVSLHARPGQTIALVGPTGAGKTTIINLLSRFYDIQNGSIQIDGLDIRDVRRSGLRGQLGIVLQDSFLFSASVRENIRYGRLNATDEEIYEAARLANADHFIRRLPHGYDTELSERGGNLSQGQRQLLSIARAILADPAILILDEATSSVDTRTEMHIQEAMLRLMQGRTSFVIAHRLSTIREADAILVIDQGRIIERGSHSELIAQDGFYKHLYTSQFRGQEAVI